jgi:predicted signal transduction protein with EAL and GGDEF domain
VARLGGDEFVVLLPELTDEQYAAVVAQKILAAAARPFTVLGHEFRVTASIGISTYPQDGLDEETLKKNADIAMYHAKAEGKNNYQFYSEELNANSLERLALESSLRHALERQEFRLHYYQLLPDLTAILAATGLSPGQLEIELHESLLIQDVDNTLRILTQLKALGVRIAVDDFGTGYSSLATLQRFPLDTIKVDRSITREFLDAGESSQLADAIIAMGKSLSLTVIAQGVETREQAELLRRYACDELQGFYFRRPLPADQFAELRRDQATEITYAGARSRPTTS